MFHILLALPMTKVGVGFILTDCRLRSIKLTIPEGGYSISYYHHPNFVSGLSWDEFIFLLAKSGLRMIDKQSQYELTL